MREGLISRILKEVADLNRYDHEELTPPAEINELLTKSEHFVDWLEEMLKYSARLTLDILEDEIDEKE